MTADDRLVQIRRHYYHYSCVTYRPRQAADREAAPDGSEEPDG